MAWANSFARVVSPQVTGKLTLAHGTRSSIDVRRSTRRRTENTISAEQFQELGIVFSVRTKLARQERFRRRGAYTLLEVVLVVGILASVSAMVVPVLMGRIRGDALPRSARQLRSLITLVRANAAFDGKRYQIRFPNEDELDSLGGETQPLIEREEDPIYEPEKFVPVTAPWAVERTLLGDVWCAEVRLGRPTIERIVQRRERAAESIEEALEEGALEEYEPERLPLVISPDSSSEWATFVLTEAPRPIELDELEGYPRIELIVDGATGLAWMQRPFYDEELDLFEEKNWPAVLRQDFLDERVLTENDVLELREEQIYGDRVELKGRKIEVEDESGPEP